jgi:hypothetical protein
LRLCLGLLTPVYGQVAGAMVDSLRNETVVRTSAAGHAFRVRPRGLSEAIWRALVSEDREFAETRWSDALPTQRPLGCSGITLGRRLVSSRVIEVRRPPERAFEPIKRIGGRAEWYAGDWFWRARGLLDTLRGGSACGGAGATGTIFASAIRSTSGGSNGSSQTVSCASRPR